jgi:hypothetical protein
MVFYYIANKPINSRESKPILSIESLKLSSLRETLKRAFKDVAS